MNVFRKKILWLLNLILKVFKRKKIEQQNIDYNEEKEELWECNFSSCLNNKRFEKENGNGYKAFFNQDGNFVLKLERKNIYAWCINKFFRYKNFILEAKIGFVKDSLLKEGKTKKIKEDMAGVCAIGFIFRYIEKTFYSFLVSDLGFFRIDVVINNTPKTLIPWTKVEDYGTCEDFEVGLIVLGDSITCLINRKWVGKVENDVIDVAGKIAFEAQNYSAISNISGILKSISLNSKIVEVQKRYDEANDNKKISIEARRRLCESYYNAGNIHFAMNELKKIEDKKMKAKDAMLSGKIYFLARLLEDAEKYFLKAIELDSCMYIEANTQLLSLYYYFEQYEKMKIILEGLKDKEIDLSSSLCFLKAHYLHHLGLHKEAANFYKKAFVILPDEAIFALNAAREYESANDTKEAISFYIKACNVFLRKKEYLDIEKILNVLESIAKDDERYWAVSSKYNYEIAQYDKAKFYIKKLIEKNTKDSNIWYIYSLILKEEGNKDYLNALEKAYSFSPLEFIYCLGYAEALFLNKKPCEKYILEAINLDKTNGLAYNLYARLMLEKNELDKALEYEKIAREYLPLEITIFANYLHIKSVRGEIEDCYSLFGIKNVEPFNEDKVNHSFEEDPAVEANRGQAYNIFANELEKAGNIENAYLWHEKALKLEPNNAGFLFDSAVNALKAGYLNEANEKAWKALGISAEVKTYSLIAKIAKEMGDYAQSEFCLIKAIEEFGENVELLLDLVYLYLFLNKKDKALSILEQIKKLDNIKDIEKDFRFIEAKKMIER